MKSININGRLVGKAHPTFVIAEAGDNHMGSLATAIQMANMALVAGADAVKYQHHLPDEEMLPDVPTSDNMREPLYDFLVKNALTLDDHITLKKHCDKIGIQYLCTPFSFQAALELQNHGLLDAIKIGSGEMTDIPSLSRMADFGVPMILSTGMSTFEEINETYSMMMEKKVSFALLNCVSEYPPEYDDINLGVIKKMQESFPGAVIGHSDHTPTNYTAFAAVTLGAAIIEKHVIIDKLTPGPDQSVSLNFHEFNDLVSGIRIIEAASGDSKKVHEKEKAIREWAFRSVVAIKEIPAGKVIEPTDVWTKRPGTGIPSAKLNDVIGRTSKVCIKENTLLSWDQLI